MPTLDVTELFEDPDLASPIDVIRLTQRVDAHGRAVNTPATTRVVGVNTPATTRVVGVIQPARARTLALLPDLARTSGAVEVWCRYDLKEGAQTTAPDEVLWLGQTYTVVHVDAWRNEAGGSWTHAVCELKDLVAPTESETI